MRPTYSLLGFVTAVLIVACSDAVSTVPPETGGAAVSAPNAGSGRDTAGQPRDTGSKPRDTTQAPRDTSKAPRDTSKTPRDTSKAPRDTSKTPKDSARTPRDSTPPRGDTTGTKPDTGKAPPAIRVTITGRVLGVDPGPAGGRDSLIYTPIATATVRLWRNELVQGQTRTVLVATVVSNESGGYSFTDVPAGYYVPTATPPAGSVYKEGRLFLDAGRPTVIADFHLFR